MSDPRGKIELTYVRRLPGLDALITEIEVSRQQESALLAAIAAPLSQRIAEAEEADPDSGYAMITGFARTTGQRRADAPLDGRVLTCDCRSRSCAS